MKKILLVIVVFNHFITIGYSQFADFKWAKGIVSNENVSPSAVETDKEGNIFIAGEFSGKADFDPGMNSFYLESFGYDDVFLQKLTSDGRLIWVRQIGENYNDVANDLTLDTLNNIYITGTFSRTVDFDPGEEVHELSTNGGNDIYIAKYDSAGNYKWAVAMGYDNASDEGTAITTDHKGNVLITGWFQGTVDFDPGEGVHNLTTTRVGCFILKLTDEGEFIWAKNLNSNNSGMTEGHSIETDDSSNVYVSGIFDDEADFNPGDDSKILQQEGDYANAFLLKLNKNGDFRYAIRPGGWGNNSNLDKKRPFSIDNKGNITLAYDFNNAVDFDPGEEVHELTTNGIRNDIFIQKIDSLGNLLWVKQIGGPDEDSFGGFHTDEAGNSYITGYFTGTVDFDPGDDIYELSAGDDWNRALFVAQYSPEGDLIQAHPVNWTENDGSWPYGKGFDITTDLRGNILSVGQFSSSFDFNPNGVPAILTSSPNNFSGYVLKLGSTATASSIIEKNKMEIKVFPNPFHGKITIFSKKGLKNATVSVSSASGRILKTYQIPEVTSFEIDMEKSPAGIYFLEVIQQNRQTVAKMVKP